MCFFKRPGLVCGKTLEQSAKPFMALLGLAVNSYRVLAGWLLMLVAPQPSTLLPLSSRVLHSLGEGSQSRSLFAVSFSQRKESQTAMKCAVLTLPRWVPLQGLGLKGRLGPSEPQPRRPLRRAAVSLAPLVAAVVVAVRQQGQAGPKLACPRWQTSTVRTKVCSQTALPLFVSGLSRSALILPPVAARL